MCSFTDVGSPDGGRGRRQGRGDLGQKVCLIAASGMKALGQGYCEDLCPGGGLGGGGRWWQEYHAGLPKHAKLDS